jgi:hypothetical protein
MSDSDLIVRDYPQVENELKYPSRYTKDTFATYEVRESNSIKWKYGINYKTNRKITIGGRIHNELRENFMIVVI